MYPYCAGDKSLGRFGIDCGQTIWYRLEKTCFFHSIVVKLIPDFTNVMEICKSEIQEIPFEMSIFQNHINFKGIKDEEFYDLTMSCTLLHSQ